MKFDFVIGNPPYNEEIGSGDNKTYAPQVYDKFLDASYEIADTALLIHPGRFLFNAGSTPKAWNKKMLEDPHLKILEYEPDPKKVFPETAITGGIAITYHDVNREFGAIGVFTTFDELNSILRKVSGHNSFESIKGIVVSRTAYRLTDKLHEDHPEAISQLSKGHAYDMSSNIFKALPQIFFKEKPDDGYDYISMLGRLNDDRTYMFVRREYVNHVYNLDKYKIIMARADGAAGTIGKPIPARVLGTPSIEPPGIGTTESFLSMGSFDNEIEAKHVLKYIKTRFVRTLLSILKTTQDITPEKWQYVPKQDFSSKSDIDWNKTISEIDQFLYRKYGLKNNEIDFIKKHVKEMA